MKRKFKGFTLVEMLVVMAILSIVGVLIVAIFTNTLRGSNKSQILLAIKQNGQAVLETMDKSIRNADELICIGNNSIVVRSKQGEYIRYTIILDPSKKTNGSILYDNPVQSAEQSYESFKADACNIFGAVDLSSPVILTDTREQSGVSVVGGSFSRNQSADADFEDVITIQFVLARGVKAPVVLTGQIDPVTFQTSVELR